MISDLIQLGTQPPRLIQPVADVAQYLAQRVPVLDCLDELPLLLTLPSDPYEPRKDVRGEVKCRCAACLAVKHCVAAGSKVQPVIIQVLSQFQRWNWKLGTFRALYDRWDEAKDWVVLVNRSRAGLGWVNREPGLEDVFLDFVAGRCGAFKRSDALPEAIRSIHRQWRTGLNHLGMVEMIPGYAADWNNRNRHRIPDGWTPGNLRRQLAKRSKYLKVHKALLHEGIAAARKFIPQVRSTREGLRFMEEIQFDDVKCDFRVFDTATGKPVDLWLLVAHDRATAMLLGFGLRPATVREDGSQEHLKLSDTKQLLGWVLEHYGLPPYQVTLKMENGTASMTDGTAAAIMEMLPERLKVSFASMIGGDSPSGFRERALGNSKGKASLESGNRIMHMIAAGQPGQTGPSYGVRPKDLASREKECVTIWEATEDFPTGLREKLVNEFGYPLLTLQQARQEVKNIFTIRNNRTDHALEGFEKILVKEGGELVQRMESPAERATKLAAGLTFTPVSPEIIAAFYEHTERAVRVTDAGEIEFHHEGRKLTFARPDGGAAMVPGSKCLAYFHPDDPRLLHLTNGKGAFLGTWLRRSLVRHGDEKALNEAIHYANSALKAAKERAAEINPENAQLKAMRERNQELLQAGSFIDVTDAPAPIAESATSHIASGLIAAKQTVKQKKTDAVSEYNAGRDALMNLG